MCKAKISMLGVEVGSYYYLQIGSTCQKWKKLH